MSSLGFRIFLILVLMTIGVWGAAAVWINVHTRNEVERVLDRRLVEAARMVGSLVESRDAAQASGGLMPLPGQARAAGLKALTQQYERQLSCQIWSFDGRLIGRSAGAPAQPLGAAGAGFSEREVGGQLWRVYTLDDPRSGVRVMVGDSLAVRQGLVQDVTTGLLLPAILGILALAALIWSGVGKGLRPLRRIAEALESRKPDDFTELEVAPVARELAPVVDALNSLFGRLANVRDAERHLIASAAHELQTPLAGIRMHAQIALAADDPSVRVRAERQIISSVDRAARLVRQLLDLARHEAQAEEPAPRWLPVSRVLEVVQGELQLTLEKADVSIEANAALLECQVFMNEESLLLALRNLIENAVQHSPFGGTVRCGLEPGPEVARVFVDDEGPGIPADEIERVRQRFVRGRREQGVGSGLGLSIVDLTLARSQAQLVLTNRSAGGLRAAIEIAPDRVRLRHSNPLRHAAPGEIDGPVLG